MVTSACGTRRTRKRNTGGRRSGTTCIDDGLERGRLRLSNMPVETREIVGTCWECGYSLKGLETHRCPECGRPFDPGDPSTMNMDTPVGPVAAFLMSPPGWPLYVMTGVAVLLSVWVSAAPGPNGRIGNQVIGLWNDSIPDALPHIERLEVRYLCACLAWGAVLAVWFVRRVARG